VYTTLTGEEAGTAILKYRRFEFITLAGEEIGTNTLWWKVHTVYSQEKQQCLKKSKEDETKHLDGSLSMGNTATSKSNGLSPYNSHRG